MIWKGPLVHNGIYISTWIFGCRILILMSAGSRQDRIQSCFKDWLQSTGKVRQLSDLAKFAAQFQQRLWGRCLDHAESTPSCPLLSSVADQCIELLKGQMHLGLALGALAHFWLCYWKLSSRIAGCEAWKGFPPQGTWMRDPEKNGAKAAIICETSNYIKHLHRSSCEQKTNSSQIADCNLFLFGHPGSA